MGQRSSSAATLPEIVVLGDRPPLNAVAAYLHERGPYEVSQRTDETRPLPDPSPSRAQVFIAYSYERRSTEVLRRLLHMAHGQALLFLCARGEVASAWSDIVELYHATQRSLEHQASDTLIVTPHLGQAIAPTALIDFVCTRDPGSELDREELTETAWRVHRLALLAETSRSAPKEGLHDPESGRIDADRVATFLGISLRSLARAFGWNYTTVHKTPDSPSVQEALGPFARTIELLRKLHPSAQSAREWLNTPHRELEERAPLQVMLDGRADAVRDMLEGAYLGLPT
jgi:hypothetical protein